MLVGTTPGTTTDVMAAQGTDRAGTYLCKLSRPPTQSMVGVKAVLNAGVGVGVSRISWCALLAYLG